MKFFKNPCPDSSKAALGKKVGLSVMLMSLCFAAGCTEQAETSLHTVPAALKPAGITVSNVALDLGPRVLPEGTTTATVTATITNVPRNVTLSLSFAGNRAVWPSADLPQVSKSRDRYTFRGTLTAPVLIGLHDLSWAFKRSDASAPFGPVVSDKIEVTCSDGLFCNGEERYTRRGCVSTPQPCDDGVSCTRDSCDEAARTCTFEPQGQNCASCDAKNCNPRCGPHQECGDDGCGDPCITPATDSTGQCLGGLSCLDERCQDVQAPGTCTFPLPLLGDAGTAIPDAGILTTVLGDTSTGLDALKVSCGGTGIKELVYRFDIGVKMGLDIRMLSASGDPDALDTVLAVHKDDCLTQVPFGGFCSDDAAPPGGLGSRVYGPLDPGSYRLVATGYSASQVGPVQLQVKIVPACVPACDGKFCGPDGCGGSCGSCSSGQLCSSGGRCFTSPCTPDCSGGRQCGDDGCGGSCGSCSGGDLCAELEGRCVPPSGCDHFQPTCKSCGPKSYCGTDCQCHPTAETLIDLIPAPAATLLPSIEFEWRSFEGSSCGLAEGCVPGPGRWLLMRFSTDVLNQGLAGFKPGDPTTQPELFDYHECHQHYHFSGFANYSLLSYDGAHVLSGRKLSYCMEDSYQHLTGPNIPCEAGSTCDDQGIQPGWADSYPATLDCQWLVLRGTTPAPTDLTPGQWYLHETCTNTGRAFHEHTFDNNCIRIPVYIPDVPDNGQVLRYIDLSLPPAP